MAEYSTQVQHDQLIFPQSFGRGARVRQGGSLPKCNNRFKGWSRRAFFSHLVFDLCSHLEFPNSRFQQTNRLFDHLTRQDGRPSHLRQLSSILAHSEALHLAHRWDPAHLGTSLFLETLQLPHGNLGGVESHAAGL